MFIQRKSKRNTQKIKEKNKKLKTMGEDDQKKYRKYFEKKLILNGFSMGKKKAFYGLKQSPRAWYDILTLQEKCSIAMTNIARTKLCCRQTVKDLENIVITL